MREKIPSRGGTFPIWFSLSLCWVSLTYHTLVSFWRKETPEAKIRTYNKLNPLVTAGPKIKSTMHGEPTGNKRCLVISSLGYP